MLYWIIILIVLAEFAFSITLTALNRKASHNPIPKLLEGIYDEERYSRQQAYSRENSHVGLLGNIADTALLLGLFAFGGFAWIDALAQGLTGEMILRSLIFFIVFYLVDTVIGIPFSAYATFSIEERYGFNRTSPKLFVLDTLKGMGVSLVLYSLIIGVVVWIYELIPEWFWLVAWAVMTVIMLVLQFFYSDVIVPLFNKQTPLAEGELRTAIETFARKVDFKLDNIYVIDGSKRSSKANAYFTGFGSRKRIVLYDTLISPPSPEGGDAAAEDSTKGGELSLTTDEIVAVLAHEIGHYKHRHILKGIVTGLLTNLIMLWLFSLVIDSKDIAAAAGCQSPSFYINMTVFMLLLTPLQIVLGMIGNVTSRKHEWQADEFAKVHGLGAPLISSLKKMSAQSLSNLTPHPAVVFTQYSHPTLLQRVEHLMK